MTSESSRDGLNLIHVTAGIVAAFLQHNLMQTGDVGGLIRDVHAALSRLAGPQEQRAAAQKLKPAVHIRHSVTDDYIVCLEDGARLKSLKRHLMRNHGMTIDGYRQKWDLPADYPVIAASYSSERSALAKRLGLGRRAG